MGASSASKPAALLSNKQQKARERCFAEEPTQASVNSALLKIFSAPGVMDAADRELEAGAAKSLKDLVKNVEAAQREEIHPVRDHRDLRSRKFSGTHAKSVLSCPPSIFVSCHGRVKTSRRPPQAPGPPRP